MNTPAPANPWARGWQRAVADAWPGQDRVHAAGRSLLPAGQLHFAPGSITATVGGHRASITVSTLTDAQWDSVVDAVGSHPVHPHTVLAGQLPVALADPGHTAGVPLIPRPGDLSARCPCRAAANGRLCAHAAAVAYAFATRLASQPQALCSLRGRPLARIRAALADRPEARCGAAPGLQSTGLRGHQHPSGAPERHAGPGSPIVRADHAFAAWHAAPLPATGPERTEHPARGPAAQDGPPDLAVLPPPPSPAPGLRDLQWLTADAAKRAQRLLSAPAPAHAPSPGDQVLDGLDDAIRLLATHAAHHTTATAERAGLASADLRRLTAAWRHGGAAGLATARGTTGAEPEELGAAMAELAVTLGDSERLTTRDGHITDTQTQTQLRYGPDHRWHPFRHDGTDWTPVVGAHTHAPSAFHAATAPT